VSDREQRIFFGDCDTREKAVERLSAFTGSEFSAWALMEAYEEISRLQISQYFSYSISGWIN
jgi:hypothetical protein